ncbi:sigma-E processing peptidase SpoIIGA [Sporolactobacillus sp. CPB3-1]|uniref:Sporulation sigma-E factor-processing peptidase n=1 Tax=Sporolactobacillus mangiferae TaxID=2940498 RepID=A0ABT0M7V4_9BACL|nr:sigma-E processing peptidase SpoIIGA [Sporolactobacillus mangiferae]MCL1630939.1 sigma-E processing peptidase SpoIIGA [Sporolactobacillus mangiferae]
MVVYLDAVWVLNLLIDACLLKLTALMLKRETTWLRFWLGALTASAIILLLFTPAAFIVDDPLGKFAYSVLIILIVFGFRRPSVFLQNIAAFYFVAFAIGGGLFAIHYFFQDASFYAGSRFLNTMTYGDPISWITVCLGFPVLWFFSKKRIDQTAIRKWNHTTITHVTIQFFDHCFNSKAMIDSGNKLTDPITHAPVMFLEKCICGDVVPDALFQKGDVLPSVQDLDHLPEEWRNRLAWIPYRGVDGSNQLALAARADQVLIQIHGKQLACTKVFVIFVSHSLSSAGDFNCILNPDLLLQGKEIKSAS